MRTRQLSDGRNRIERDLFVRAQSREHFNAIIEAMTQSHLAHRRLAIGIDHIHRRDLTALD